MADYFGGGGSLTANADIAGQVADAQAAQPHGGGGLLGLLGQARDLTFGAPAGLIHFLGSAFTDPAAGALVGGALGTLIPIPGVGTALGAGIGAAIGGGGDIIRHQIDPNAPWSPVGESFGRTGQDILHPTRLARAYQDGTLVGRLVEDITNASIITEGLGKGFAAGVKGVTDEAAAATQRAAAADAATADLANRLQEVHAAQGTPGTQSDPGLGAQFRELTDQHAGATAAADQARAAAEAAQQVADRASRHLKIYQTVTRGAQQGAFAPFLPWRLAKIAAVGGEFAGKEFGGVLGKVAEGEGRAAAGASRVRDVLSSREAVRARAAKVDALIGKERDAWNRAVSDIDRAARKQAAGLTEPADQIAADYRYHKIRPEAAQPLVDMNHNDPALFDAAASWYGDRYAVREADRPVVEAAFRKVVDSYDPANTTPETQAFREGYLKWKDAFEANPSADGPAGLAAIAEARYLNGIGERDFNREYRQWNVAGTTPNPLALADVRQHFDTLRARREANLAAAQSYADRVTADAARAGQLPTGVTSADVLDSVLTHATEIASRLLDVNDPAARAAWGDLANSGVPRFADIGRRAQAGQVDQHLILELRDRIIAQADRSTTDPIAGALTTELRNRVGIANPYPARVATGGQPLAAVRRGVTPLQSSQDVVTRLAGAVGKVERTQGQIDQRVLDATRRVGLAERTLRRLPSEMDRALEQASRVIENAPSRYREALYFNRALVGAFNDLAGDAAKYGPGAADVLRAASAEVTLDLAGVVDQGFNPRYRSGKLLPEQVGEARPSGASTAERLPRQGAVGTSTKIRRGEHAERTVAAQGEVLARDYRTRIQNEVVFRVGELFGGDPNQHAADQFAAFTAAHDATKGRYSVPRVAAAADLANAMEAAGFKPWDPSRVSATGVRTPQAITPDTIWLPSDIIDTYHRQTREFDGQVEQFLKDWVDRPTRVWKHAVLALRPAWQIGNLFGNETMATLGGGLSLGDLAHYGRMAYAVLRETPPDVLAEKYGMPEELRASLEHGRYVPPELTHRGYLASDAERLGMQLDQTPPSKLGDILRHPIRSSYEWNGAIDDWNRLTIFLAKLDKGFSESERAAFRQTHPEIAPLVGDGLSNVDKEMAVRLSLDVAGDFTRMSSAERYIFRRAVTFWPWIRHITQLAWNLGTRHPLRVAWLLRVGGMADESGDGVGFLAATVPLPFLGENWRLRLPNVNPFTTPFDIVEPSGTFNPVGGLVAQGNPVADAALALGTGRSFGDLGGVPVAPGGQVLDEFGRSVPQPLLTDWSGRLGPLPYPARALSYLAGRFPQLALVKQGVPAALLGDTPIARTPTGDPYLVGGATIPGDPYYGLGGRLSPVGDLLRLFGLPAAQQIDVNAIVQRATQRRAQAAVRG